MTQMTSRSAFRPQWRSIGHTVIPDSWHVITASLSSTHQGLQMFDPVAGIIYLVDLPAYIIPNVSNSV